MTETNLRHSCLILYRNSAIKLTLQSFFRETAPQNIVDRNSLLTKRNNNNSINNKSSSIYWGISKCQALMKQGLYIYNTHNNPLDVIIISYYLHLPKEETGTMKCNSNYLGGKKIQEYLSLDMNKKKRGKDFLFIIFVIFPIQFWYLKYCSRILCSEHFY